MSYIGKFYLQITIRIMQWVKHGRVKTRQELEKLHHISKHLKNTCLGLTKKFMKKVNKYQMVIIFLSIGLKI